MNLDQLPGCLPRLNYLAQVLLKFFSSCDCPSRSLGTPSVPSRIILSCFWCEAPFCRLRALRFPGDSFYRELPNPSRMTLFEVVIHFRNFFTCNAVQFFRIKSDGNPPQSTTGTSKPSSAHQFRPESTQLPFNPLPTTAAGQSPRCILQRTSM